MKFKVILLVLIAATLVFGQGRNNRGQMMTWDENLNLTTEQMQEITNIRQSMQPAMQEMRQNIRTLELELRQINQSNTPDAQRIAELETAINEQQTAVDAIMSAHRDQIRMLLTPDQQLIFDERNFGPREDRGSRQGRRGGNRSDSPRGNRRGGGNW